MYELKQYNKSVHQLIIDLNSTCQSDDCESLALWYVMFSNNPFNRAFKGCAVHAREAYEALCMQENFIA